LFSTLGLALAAQTAPAPAAATPAATAAPAPVLGAIKWRGALWASGATSNQQTPDGSMFLRTMDAPDGSLALDGLQLGGDVNLADGWSFKFTLLTGQDAKVLNAASQQNGSPMTGDIAYPEAMLTWTGANDTVKIGRMYTPMGMEVMDQTQNATASRGLLFSFAVPFGQVGIDWHHAFTPSWSTDLYLYNGEDQVTDNNKSKSGGLGLTYNHAGAADKFVTLMAFTGAEQNGLGANSNTGAEGRKRNRLSLAGQWVWGPSTLQFEGEYASESMAGSVAGTTGDATARWNGFGFIYKYQVNDNWAWFARAEALADNTGLRLLADPTIKTLVLTAPAANADLRAEGFAVGVERRWHATFCRVEVRDDHLNKTIQETAAENNKSFNSAVSATVSLGTSF
jgi:hypothetical protein